MNLIRTSDGIQLNYEISGTGRPVILLSGQGQDMNSWDSILPFLTPYFQVIRFDYRGTGYSDEPVQGYSTEIFADDAIAVLDHLGISKAHALGISMGGRVCQWLGIKYPERIFDLVLVSTTPGNKHGSPRTNTVNEIMKSSNYRALAELTFTNAYLKKIGDTFMPLSKRSISDFARRQHFLASENHNVWERLGDIKCRVLILHGSDDQINPTANAQLLASQISDSQVVIIDKGRHGMLEEFKEECMIIITHFFNENS